MNDDALNTLLGIDPTETREAVVNVVQEAADMIAAEDVASLPVDAEVMPETAIAVPPAPTAVKPDPHAEDMNEDVDFAREQIKQLIDDGRSAMNGIMELAAAGDQPRAYEVVATLLTAVVNANKELIHIHKTRKDALKADKEAKQVPTGPGGSSPVNIDKAVFIGTTSNLLRELQNIKKQAAAELKDKD